ncbi:DNA repair protein RecN [Endozoicomonas numazuensis]|uniref:DNA repair protein RecN n=1 Tax=Endozoicomonas numazuensis TaxID=1137799 RepID=A0A081NEQ3_9GAMM|nr:DNA repair protein RecN [Endozoicomonas numazuensis]KEQ16926.1 recombination and repair protein [Endozoicomonas numazuensis]
MLTQLSISNFAIVDQLDLDINSGMTVITGETGAGKSIMLDALGLATGDRTDSHCVRQDSDKAEIHASFDINQCTAAKKWLEQKELSSDDECILRRVITKEGRSRAYINGTLSPLADLRAIGELLIDIHGQHESQSLLKKTSHRLLLDDFSCTQKLASAVARIAHEFNQTHHELDRLTNNRKEQDERIQLLSYQLQELEQLSIQEGELEQLEKELKQLTSAESTLSVCHQVNDICSENEAGNILQQLTLCMQRIGDLQTDHSAINNTLEMISSAQIQIEEAVGELNHFIDHFDADPARMQEVDERLSAIYELARKHRVQPEELLEKQHTLSNELESIQFSDERAEELQKKLIELKSDFQSQCKKLSKKRQTAARQLEKKVTKRLALLGLPHGQLTIALTPIEASTLSPNGAEDIEFLVTTNPGQPPRALAKVASGGELSRISLAIQVITAQTSHIPSMVFDEVDVGIGGGTAETVGSMLRELGEKSQVLCVTHQPQVASQGHQHLHVSKKVRNAKTSTEIAGLKGERRIKEVARMLGGLEMTESTLNHAKEMLNLSSPKSAA